MGRKIPAKKHRGVKDPLEQQARRLQSLKSKINAPPTDPDEQPVPRSLARLFAFQQPNHEPRPNAKNKHTKLLHKKDSDGSGVGDNPISRLRKLPGESGRGFSLRINSAVRALHGDVTLEDYPRDMEEEEEEDGRGARMAELRERRARKRRRAAGGAAPRARSPAASPPRGRARKLALRNQAKREKADEVERERRELVYERVAFGDVAHAPPALRVAPPRAACRAPSGAPPTAPGRRDLLLSKLLRGGGGGGGAGAEAERRERARLDAVSAYRALKAAKKNLNKNNKPTRVF